MGRDFWAEQCSERGSALTHDHWAQCKPKSVHPYDGTDASGRTHLIDMCCYCELTQAMETELRIAMQQLGEKDPRPLADHLYQPTMLGVCLHCQRRIEHHPTFLRAPLGDECPVDHARTTSRLLLGDGGLKWTACPICSDTIEPKLATGRPVGNETGRGRGPLSQRHKEDLLKVRKREDFNNWVDAQHA